MNTKRILLSNCEIKLLDEAISYYLKRNGTVLNKKDFEKLLKLKIKIVV